MKNRMLQIARLVVATCCLGISAHAAALYESEEDLDRLLGVLDKPWAMNQVRLRTRSDLRAKAQVKTGLPSYDQQVERAQAAPASLVTELNTPVVVVAPRVVRRTPSPVARSTTPAPSQPAVSPTPPSPEQSRPTVSPSTPTPPVVQPTNPLPPPPVIVPPPPNNGGDNNPPPNDGSDNNPPPNPKP